MLIKDFGDYTLHHFSNERAPSICEFTVRVNYQVHKQQVTEDRLFLEAQKICKEELNLFQDPHYYVILNKKDEMIGTIRAGLWNKKKKLPIHEEFEIPAEYRNQQSNVWHIGRFAVDPLKMDENIRKHRLMIFKLLLFHAIQHVCAQDENIMLAECDRKLHEKVKLLNICSKEIGESKQYIGSETVPIFNTSNALKLFLWNHMHLQCLPVIESTLQGNNRKESDKQKSCSQELDLAA
ncbi:MAG: hypothetical protein FWC41_10945 [Firmicutes bacterium]|nr:hypothetical protein [Bacillota bacterium]